jgi:outer membrane protein OmpA-like peptidoglycan-associated protein
MISAGTGQGKVASIGDVLFDIDKAVIRPEGIVAIDKVITYMKDNPTTVMEVAGHTDSNGTDEYNIDLSTRRSNACRDYMISKGIFATRLIAKGYGEGQPVSSNATADGRQKNRRTEFVVVKNN